MIIITGVDGFLGANLAKYLIGQGLEVIGTALNRKYNTSLDVLGVNCRIEYGDVTDRDFISRVINSYEPDWVIHLAAVSIVRIAEENIYRTMQTNIMGTINLLEACRRSKSIKSIVVASSDKAYGDYGGSAYIESLPLKPTGVYEVSKACADMISRLYDLPVKVTRCANLYGPGDLNFSRLIPNSCRQAAHGKSPIIHGGAWHNVREYLYVEDACRAYKLILETGEPCQAYNIGSGDLHATGEIAQRIAYIAEVSPAIEVEKKKSFYEIPAQRLDCNKISKLGWKSEILFPVGIVKTLNWYTDYFKKSYS